MKSLTVYVGLDTEEQPPKEDYPLCIVYAVERTQKGNEVPDNIYQVATAIVISDDVIDVATEPTTGTVIRKYRGLYRVEELRDLIEREILRITGIGAKINANGETFLQTMYPHFRAGTMFNFEYHKSLRSGR